MIELSDIVGQEQAISRLQSLLRASRMPHAFLFAGPDGVGRRTTAEALARTLLCGNRGKDASFIEACGECEDCRMMAAGSHPDFQYVYKELAQFHDDPAVRSRKMQDMGIDVIRSFLIAPAGRSANRGRGKVFIVLEAELMSIAAQNALLKTLEEPPPGVTIILISERPDRLLPTTLSRCGMIRFGPLPDTFVAEKLATGGLEAEEAKFWASFAAGSIGQALELSEQGMYEIKQDVVSRLAELSKSGDSELGEYLAKVADNLAEKAVSAAKREQGAELSKQLAFRRAAGIMLELIASAYQDAMMLAVGSDRKIIHSDQTTEVTRIAERFDPTGLAGIIESLSRCEQLLWRNVNPKIVWDNVVITCASAAPLGV